MKKRVLFVALALFSFAAFFSCSNAAGGSDSESSKPSSASASKKPGYVTLTGTVSVSGAVPKILSDNYDSSSDNGGVSRSAQPGINTSGDGATMEYFARATSGDLVSEGAFGSGAEAKMFGLELQAGIEWTIVVGVREKSTQKPIPARTVYLSSTWKVKPDPAAPTISHNFVPVPNTSGGTGSIALKIKYSPSLYEITPKFVDGPSGFEALNDENWTKLEKSDGWIFQLSGVKSGKYELCLDFKVKSTNEIVYSTIQSVTVANGMTTDSWVADSSSSAVSPISASGEFNFNSNASTLMAAFLGTNLFVGKVSDDCDAPADTNSGNYLSPLATVTAAVEKIASFGNKDSDYFVRVSGTVGAMGSRLPADIESISKSSNAKSLTIIGTSGSNADCIKTASAANPAVKVSTDVPVTFKNIKIMGVSGGMGSGMAISAFGGSNVTIDEGCLITGGKVGVSVTGDSTKVTMKGGSFSGNDADVYLASEKVLTVDCNLSDVADKGIVVSLQSWTRGTQFSESGEHLSAITEDIVKKFDFTKTGWDTPIYDSDKKAKIDADIYVAASGKDSETVDGITVENTIGNKNYPFASIKQASKYLDASHGTIYVKGSVSGAQEIPSTVASTCTAIKLTGLSDLPTSGTNAYVPSDEINAGGAVGAGTALKVATSVPVTIENLKITGGRSGTSRTGGGISVNAGSVTLSDGAWVSGNLANGNVNCGGGVYVKSEAKLFMRGKSLVGDKSAATNESGANNLEVGQGGGICNEGSVYIGCNESGVAATGYALDDGYGVRGNWSNQYGGGIANLGTLIIASGEISYNATDYNAYSEGWGAVSTPGGGVYNKSGSLTINGGKIYANKSTDGGGIYLQGGSAVMNGGTIGGDTTDMGNVAAGKGLSSGGGLVINTSCEFKMLGGTISHNSAKNFGGAVSASGTFTMSGGIISENEVNGLGDVHGGAVYVYGTFNLNGSAYIPSGVKNSSGVLVSGAGKNDVYLYNGRTVTVTGTLSPRSNGLSSGTAKTNSIEALALSSWSRGTKFLSASGSYTALSENDLKKFDFTDSGWDKERYKVTSDNDAAKITSPIYVASSGDADSTRIVCSKAPTSGNNGTKAKPYATIAAALADSELSKVSNTITIDGTLSAQTIENTTTVASGVTVVTLQGYKASGAATSAATINGKGTSIALNIAKSLTYTIKDLKITNGKSSIGGGIHLAAGTLNLESGATVYGNKATDSGAGVSVASGAILNIKDGSEIYSNSAYSGNISGGGIVNSGSVNISGGKIYQNSANKGGAIYNWSTVTITGGTIGGSGIANSATTAGAAIYQDGTLYMKGAGVVDGSNDVYLASGKFVTVTGAFDSSVTTAATITPDTWKRMREIVYPSGTGQTVDGVKDKFKLSKDDGGWERVTKNVSSKDYLAINSPIYVVASSSSSGSRPDATWGWGSASGNGTKTSPYSSIADALGCADITSVKKITIAGTIKGNQSIASAKIPSGLAELEITGYNNSATLNGNASGTTLSVSAGSATFPVTITNLNITGGKSNYGGGIYIGEKGGTVNLGSGAKVYSNNATSGKYGAGVYVSGGATLNIKSGAEIYSNTAESGNISGGGVYVAAGSGSGVNAIAAGALNMSGGYVYSNSAQNGGAVCNLGTLTMTGGTIGKNSSGTSKPNTATGTGGAIQQSGTFKISGSAIVYAGSEKSNDVYLVTGKYVTLPDSSFSGSATITPSAWNRGKQVLDGTYAGTHAGKFSVTDSDWSVVADSSVGKLNTGTTIYVSEAKMSTSTGYNTGSDSTGRGTQKYPYATIQTAAKETWKAQAYTISVNGTLKATSTDTLQSIPSDTKVKATSITLSGSNSATINANSKGSALTISKAIPVTIENLTITGGSATNGGGIYVSVKGASLTLSTGVNVTANTASANGGGVYFAGTNASGGTANLIMQGTAKIGGNTATNCGGGVYLSYANLCMSGSALIGETGSSITSAATSGSKSNSAASGGGIYLATGGKLRLGYASASAASGTTLSADYGVRHNYASNMGGGIYANGDVDFASGAISYNGTAAGSGNHGGGIYTYSGTFTMSGGTIAKNKGYYGGGVYAGGTFNMTSGTIGDSGASSAANSSSNCSNYAASLGGGVYISGGGEFSGGYIAYNYAQSGGGINVSGSNALTVKNTVQCNGASGRGTGIYDSGNLTLDGSVKFYLNNIDIIRGKTITLGSSYAQNNISYAPTVTLNTVVGTGSWDLARLLTPGSGTTLPTAYNKIALSSTDSAKYKINSKGYLLPISSTPMQVSDAAVIETACAALASGDTLTMEVTAPITPTSLNVPAGAQLTLKRSTDLSADVNNTSMSYMLKLNGKTVGSNDSGDLILDGGSTGGFKCYSPLVSGGGKMHHVTIRNNDSTKSDYSGTNPGNAGSGGAFFVGAGESLSLYNCTISNCHAEYGGAIYAYGEVYLYNTDTISNCSATEYGGALYLNAAPANTNRNGTIYASITGCSVTSYSNHGARIYAKGYSGSTYAFTYSGTNYSATSSAPVTIE